MIFNWQSRSAYIAILVASWSIAIGIAVQQRIAAKIIFDDPARVDGNWGHTTIDFGGQWLMGRLLVTGHARELYRRDVQWRILQDAYPRADEDPTLTKPIDHDAEGLAYALMGTGDGLGGALYPPIHAILMAPLALFESPRAAYFWQINFMWLMTFVAALGIARMSRGRIWLPWAWVLILSFPGSQASLHLGQNATLTLAVVVWGWVFVSRDRPILGGVVWGMLAYKPVWAASFLLVALCLGRMKLAVTMLLTGIVIGLATLPVVGVEMWFDWLKVGGMGSKLYAVDHNWIFLSRDLFGLPRRFLLDFSLASGERGNRLADVLAWSLWGVVFAWTVGIAIYIRKMRNESLYDNFGDLPAFVMVGAWLTTYHFMYYDSLIAVLPVAVLMIGRRLRWPEVVALLMLAALKWWLVPTAWYYGTLFSATVNDAWETVILLFLWGRLGWRILSE